MTIPAQNDSPAVWQNYLDMTNDVKPFLQWPSGSSTQDQLLQSTIDAACDWVQDYLGRPIAPTTFFRRFSGWSGMNGAYLSLPYYPVLDLISVNEWWGTSGEHSLTEQTPANQGGQDVYQLVPLQGLIVRTFTGLVQRPWFPGSRNVEVTWVAGYNPVPPRWRRGTLLLIRYWWTTTQQANRAFRSQQDYPGQEGMQHVAWPAVPDDIAQMFQTGLQVGVG